MKNVHLVVSHPSQVPSWVDRDNLDIVLHKDIIPEEYLPTFNSTTIEMFLHRIPGLDEQYLYFNDDMFPVAECNEYDFFRNEMPVIYMKKHLFASGLYKIQCRNSDHLARKASGKKSGFCFVRPQHICSPMLKSYCEKAFGSVKDEIYSSLSRLREEKNLNQYFFLDFMYYEGSLISEKISNKHFSTAVASAKKIASFIEKPERSFCCINDVKMGEEKFESMRRCIIDAFEARFPIKSRFER